MSVVRPEIGEDNVPDKPAKETRPIWRVVKLKGLSAKMNVAFDQKLTASMQLVNANGQH